MPDASSRTAAAHACLASHVSSWICSPEPRSPKASANDGLPLPPLRLVGERGRAMQAVRSDDPGRRGEALVTPRDCLFYGILLVGALSGVGFLVRALLRAIRQ